MPKRKRDALFRNFSFPRRRRRGPALATRFFGRELLPFLLLLTCTHARLITLYYTVIRAITRLTAVPGKTIFVRARGNRLRPVSDARAKRFFFYSPDYYRDLFSTSR